MSASCPLGAPDVRLDTVSTTRLAAWLAGAGLGYGGLSAILAIAFDGAADLAGLASFYAGVAVVAAIAGGIVGLVAGVSYNGFVGLVRWSLDGMVS